MLHFFWVTLYFPKSVQILKINASKYRISFPIVFLVKLTTQHIPRKLGQQKPSLTWTLTAETKRPSFDCDNNFSFHINFYFAALSPYLSGSPISNGFTSARWVQYFPSKATLRLACVVEKNKYAPSHVSKC